MKNVGSSRVIRHQNHRKVIKSYPCYLDDILYMLLYVYPLVFLCTVCPDFSFLDHNGRSKHVHHLPRIYNERKSSLNVSLPSCFSLWLHYEKREDE